MIAFGVHFKVVYLVNENFMLTPKSVVAVGNELVDMSGIISIFSSFYVRVILLLCFFYLEQVRFKSKRYVSRS